MIESLREQMEGPFFSSPIIAYARALRAGCDVSRDYIASHMEDLDIVIPESLFDAYERNHCFRIGLDLREPRNFPTHFYRTLNESFTSTFFPNDLQLWICCSWLQEQVRLGIDLEWAPLAIDGLLRYVRREIPETALHKVLEVVKEKCTYAPNHFIMIENVLERSDQCGYVAFHISIRVENQLSYPEQVRHGFEWWHDFRQWLVLKASWWCVLYAKYGKTLFRRENLI